MGGFVDPEMCLLLVMPTECSKDKSCLGSPASLCNSRTAAVPIHSPSCHFPQFTNISSWSNMSCPSVQIQDTVSIFSHSSLTTLCFLLSHQAKMDHFSFAHTSRCNEGVQGQLPSQYFQQEREQAPQEPLHRTADLPKAGRQKLGISTACEISPRKSICMFMSRPLSTVFL